MEEASALQPPAQPAAHERQQVTSAAADAASPAQQAGLLGTEHEYELMEFRAKWMLDGCCSINEAISTLKDQASWFQSLHEDGWQLCEPVTHDLGRIHRRAESIDLTDAVELTVQTLEMPRTAQSAASAHMEHSMEQQAQQQGGCAAEPVADELSEVEVDYRSSSEGEDGLERMPMCARSMLDGSDSLVEVVRRLQEEADWYQLLVAEGWYMEVPVDNDRGSLARHKPGVATAEQA